MSHLVNTCLICGNKDCKVVDTKISGFVKERIEASNENIKLLYCPQCDFSFYDYRFTEEESNLLYNRYRGEEYQTAREHYEPWYTKKVNDALNNSSKAIGEQQRVIKAILERNGFYKFEDALDYGGNEGRTFIEDWGTSNKYLYDISNQPSVPGVKKIKNVEEIKGLKLDFVMCNMLFEHLSYPYDVLKIFKEIGDDKTVFYIEVPSENPFSNNKFGIFNNLHLLLNPNFSKWRLFKSYLLARKGPFYPMKEHINFFSLKALRKMMEVNGFKVLDTSENTEYGAWGKTKVLSCLFTKG